MTDKELLAICQMAFEAMPHAARSREILKGLGREPKTLGYGSNLLAREVAQMINEHLKGGI
jgi:hypothetical protein